MEENVKIAKIKKSCGVGKKICSILAIIAIVGCVCSAVASFAIFGMGKEFDAEVQKGIEAGVINEGNEFGSVKMININVGSVKNLHSDIPALQKILDEQPYSITYGIYCFIMSVACAVVTVMLKFVGSVFELIIKEDTPFTDKVIKRVVTVMIVLSAVMLFTMSAGFAALGGITTWVVYTIMDYGKTLQVQSDETL
ncbi:MAG: hypothetical protein K6E60_07815 [Saccharofermentans sp.]|nr:hypothetical protein [Saccharofermentans sp.]